MSLCPRTQTTNEENLRHPLCLCRLRASFREGAFQVLYVVACDAQKLIESHDLDPVPMAIEPPKGLLLVLVTVTADDRLRADFACVLAIVGKEYYGGPQPLDKKRAILRYTPASPPGRQPRIALDRSANFRYRLLAG
jgi:hypothetical protein